MDCRRRHRHRRTRARLRPPIRQQPASHQRIAVHNWLAAEDRRTTFPPNQGKHAAGILDLEHLPHDCRGKQDSAQRRRTQGARSKTRNPAVHNIVITWSTYSDCASCTNNGQLSRPRRRRTARPLANPTANRPPRPAAARGPPAPATKTTWPWRPILPRPAPRSTFAPP